MKRAGEGFITAWSGGGEGREGEERCGKARVEGEMRDKWRTRWRVGCAAARHSGETARSGGAWPVASPLQSTSRVCACVRL